ncbi:Crp/Fnr family transcriptional regulator [Pseudomonadota bacterium]
MASISIDKLVETVPVLSRFDADFLKRIAQKTSLLTLLKGDSLFREGDTCNHYIFIVAGKLRIQKVTEDGHEIVLYRLGKGQECNLTNTCLLGGQQYAAEAIADIETEVMQLPKLAFHQALEEIPDFREDIFKNIRQGMNNLLNLVQEVAFDNMDHRLATALLEHGGDNIEVKITHQSLASELGTAREVVSRLLKEFERHGWVELYRGKIKIVDHNQLAKL